jgi:hypothetical protein
MASRTVGPDEPAQPQVVEVRGARRPMGRARTRAVMAAVALLGAALTVTAVVTMRGHARAGSSDDATASSAPVAARGPGEVATETPSSRVAAAETAPTAAPAPPTPTVPVPTVASIAPASDVVVEPAAAPPRDEALTAAPPAVVEIGPPPTGLRDKRFQPFAIDSIWNMPIGSNAEYVPAGIGQASSVSIDEEYFVFPAPTDPLRPFFTNGIFGTGRCEARVYEYDINLPDAFVVGDATHRVTPNAVAAILSSDGRTLKQMNPVSRCVEGGPLTAGWTAPDQDIYGPGALGAHGGSGLSSIGGSIRTGELTGGEPIRHALKINLWGRRWLSQAGGGHRWPAVAADSFSNDPNNPEAYGGPLPQLRMGSLLAIPGDIDIAAMGLTTPAARKLAWTMQNYGAYIVDDTAWDSHALDVESGVAGEFQAAFGHGIEATAGPWYEDVMKIFGLLAVVNNNGPDSIGGGGTTRQPLAPPIGN